MIFWSSIFFHISLVLRLRYFPRKKEAKIFGFKKVMEGNQKNQKPLVFFQKATSSPRMTEQIQIL